MHKYKTLHWWMILPMSIMQFGIFKDYWGDFSDNAWSVHIHYWTGTTWYIYLIIQPYFATHGQMNRHRTNGIIGMFIAGGVCLTALSMMNRDLMNAEAAAANPDRFGPFQPWFFLGVAAVEIIMMVGFGYAVIMSIITRKRLEDHAWWLIASVFIIMMPALGRGIQNIYVDMHIKEWPQVNIITPIYYTEAIIISLLLLGAWKYKKRAHPATWVALAINIFNCLLEPLGRSVTIQHFLTGTFKG
jgi:F0F1-type ATP synthase membrane subunit c/vacuolar-type H+-ATPase subunit K